MDSLTHIVLGACIGEAIAGKKLGNKAMLWGAVANSLPDADFIASFWLPMDRNLLAHRGFTHSLLFILLLSPLLAWVARRLHKIKSISYLTWFIFFSIQLSAHIFIDLFNNYGVGILEPFSHARFSFNTIYVFDPFFTLMPLVASVALLFISRNNKKRKMWYRIGLIVPAAYLLYGSYNKMQVDSDVRKIFADQEIAYKNYFTTPAPLNTWLWYVVAASDSGFYTGYRSVFDSQDTMMLNYFSRNDTLLPAAVIQEDKRKIDNLKRFSQGFYAIQQWHDTLVFNDLRFGQVVGWHDPQEKFVFHYFLQHNDNTMAVQRGRFARWNAETFRSLIKRIRGD